MFNPYTVHPRKNFMINPYELHSLENPMLHPYWLHSCRNSMSNPSCSQPCENPILIRYEFHRCQNLMLNWKTDKLVLWNQNTVVSKIPKQRHLYNKNCCRTWRYLGFISFTEYLVIFVDKSIKSYLFTIRWKITNVSIVFFCHSISNYLVASTSSTSEFADISVFLSLLWRIHSNCLAKILIYIGCVAN